MALSVFEKNFFYRVPLFAWLKELAQIQSESEVQKPLLTTGPMTGKMSNICGKILFRQFRKFMRSERREGFFFAPPPTSNTKQGTPGATERANTPQKKGNKVKGVDFGEGVLMKLNARGAHRTAASPPFLRLFFVFFEQVRLYL
jgi:hypothetical protein